jgi:predicted transposase YbfD/YdcC
MLFSDVFGEVPDPREFNSQHDLTEILFVALTAMLCGAKSCTEMAQFGRSKLELLQGFIPLAHGVPSHDTFSRVFRLLDPTAFNTAFMRFMAGFGEQARLETAKGVVAIDGKSLRGAYDKGCAHMPKLVASVFACDTFMTLSQAVAETGGESQAAIEALQLLSLKGCVVTGDALHCHQRLTKTVREQGGDYVLAIKANQTTLETHAKAALDTAALDPLTPIHETRDQAHDRLEIRRAFVVPFTRACGKAPLVDLSAVARVEAWRTIEGVTTHKVRHYALSRLMSPQELLSTARHHWKIENKLHWVLDVRLREDDARNRKDHGPANLATLRRLTLNVLRAHPDKASLNIKQQRAAWEKTFLIELLTHMR